MYGVHVSRTGPDRAPLNRERVLREAVALADEAGIEALSMRALAQRLGVVPMALYKHVAHKEELLDGMVDVVLGEIEPPGPGAGWKDGVRQRVLSARRSLQRHAWASSVVESRAHASLVVLGHMDALMGLFRAGGFSVDLTHHVMHALGTRMWGFTQEVFPTPATPEDPERQAALLAQFATRFPHVVEMATAGAAAHADGTPVGGGCDDQFEFEFALDVLLDGFERLHARGWTSTAGRPL